MRPSRLAARAGADRWLVSYADLVTLLLAFFATAYAISNLDAARAPVAAAAITRALGTPADEASRTPVDAAGDAEPAGNDGEIMGDRLRQALGEDIAEGRVNVASAGGQVIVSLPEAAAFDSGSAEVGGAAETVLARFVAVLAGTAQLVRVEGHTDDVPIASGRYSSNWELSTARASAVVARLIAGGIAPSRLSAAGYGEFHPRLPNDSAEARALNRRVDIVLTTPGPAGTTWGLRP